MSTMLLSRAFDDTSMTSSRSTQDYIFVFFHLCVLLQLSEKSLVVGRRLSVRQIFLHCARSIGPTVTNMRLLFFRK